MCGASLTLVANIADFCRYTPTPARRAYRPVRARRWPRPSSTTFVGGYAAAATGETNPFVAVADLTSSDALLVVLLVAIVVQGIAANIMNVYTAGLSLVNTVPRARPAPATIVVAVVAVALSGFPDVIEQAQRWITHLGNFAAPLTGVILADYLVVKRQRIDVKALFDPHGRYRYLNGRQRRGAARGRRGIRRLLRGSRLLAQGRRRCRRRCVVLSRTRGRAGSVPKIRGHDGVSARSVRSHVCVASTAI